MGKTRGFSLGVGRSSPKLMVFFALVLAVCFYGTAAWGVPDYPFTVPDAACDAVTPVYQFGNGFDLIDSNGNASHGADTITVNVRVNGGIGNANQETGVTAVCTDAGFLSDTDPQVGNVASCAAGNCDAPGDAATTDTDEQYTVGITQNGFAAEILYQPAKGTPNVTVQSGAVGVIPDFIDPATLVDKQQFTVTINGLVAAGFDFAQPWTIELRANSLVDGPGEDLSSAVIQPPPSPSLSCVKTFNVTQVDPGDDIIATVVITNNGDSETNVNVTDTLDAGLSFVAMVEGPDPDSVVAQVVTWLNLGPIAGGGGSLTLKYTLHVDAIGPGQELCNDVYAVSTEWPDISTECHDCVTHEIPPPGVPSFTQWGIIWFSLLLAASGMWLIRRRRSMS